MEAKCKLCNEFFDKHEISVARDGLYCDKCLPENAIPASFTFSFSWKGINALTDYIDGSRDIEILMTIETMREAIDKKIIEKIRSLIGGEIRQSDSESLDP
jgi:hypothetical protein